VPVLVGRGEGRALCPPTRRRRAFGAVAGLTETDLAGPRLVPAIPLQQFFSRFRKTRNFGLLDARSTSYVTLQTMVRSFIHSSLLSHKLSNTLTDAYGFINFN